MPASDPGTIAAAIASVREDFEQHPEQAMSVDTFARARLVDGLRVDVEGPNGWSATTDMSKGVGGGGSAPSPGWLLRAAIASCDAVLIAMQAAEEGVRLTHLEAEVTSESDDRGLVGSADVPAGPLRVNVVVRLAADGPPADGGLEGLVARALRRSPVSESLGRVVPLDVAVEVMQPA
ncbi:MAG TPA: OsmC family protein [Candidatus Limnocylindria bacterium]|nr:OsmC family protein [Candidatus Limnocylindria bacterium]